MIRRLIGAALAVVAILLTAGCTHGRHLGYNVWTGHAKPHGGLAMHAQCPPGVSCPVNELPTRKVVLDQGQSGRGHVFARVYHDGKLAYVRDLGYGAVTNVGVTAMANDYAWAAPSGGAINTLALAKYVATGTGTNSAAATDISLQTADSVTPVAGTQSLVSGANSQAYRVIATMNYTGTEAVTEFGLFTNGTLSATTGTPWTAGSATTGTATGTPYTASSSTVQGEQQFIFIDTTKSPNIYGLALSNTTSVVTVPAWYKVTDGTAAGTFPANTDSLVIRPVMLDHKVFSAINVNNGDSIQFTYTLTINSGG